MRKKFLKRLTAFIVMALMIIPMIPYTANAAPAGYQDGDLLLQMSALNAGSVTKNPYGATVANAIDINAKRDANDPTKILAKGTAVDASVGITTDFPLTTDSVYTIEYYVKLNKKLDPTFGFLQNNTSTTQPNEGINIALASAGSSVHTQRRWWANGWMRTYDNSRYGGSFYDGNIWKYRANDEGFVQVVMTLNKGKLTVSVGGVQVINRPNGEYKLVEWNLGSTATKDFTTLANMPIKQLWLETGWCDDITGTSVVAPVANECIIEVKDISVYAGVVDVKPTYEDGDLLLSMPAFAYEETKTVNPYGVTVANGAGANAKRNDSDFTQILANKKDERGGVSLRTSLPMNTEVAYTIEYEAKLNCDAGLAMYAGFFADEQANWCLKGVNLGVYPNGQNIKTIQQYTVDIYNQVGTTNPYGRTLPLNIWKNCADADGFVKFVMTYNKGTLTLSVDGSNIGAIFDVTSTGKSGCYDIGDVSTLNLTFGYTPGSITGYSKPEVGTHMLSVKNIAIYAGARTTVEVRDENGNVLDKKSTFDKNGISASELATVEGEQVIWCDRYTGALAEAPAGTYKRDTVLVAKSRALTASELVGAQAGEIKDNKQNIRIVSALYNLEGSSVGFDVLVRYKKTGDNTITEDKYRLVSSTVYEAINGTVDGNIINYTAASLGANYLSALVIEGVSTEYGTIEITVAAFRTFDDPDVRVYSEIATFYVVDGDISTTGTIG